MREQKTRVLIVDPTEDLASGLAPLAGDEVEICRAGSGQEAIAAAAAAAWDVVVLDLGLPDGLDVLASLVDEDPCCAVIVTSGPGGPPPGATLGLGAVRHLEQPATPADVEAAIAQVRACQTRRLRIELRAIRVVAALSAGNGRPGMTISPAALRVIRRYPWPGGSGEVYEVMGAAVARCTGREVGLEDLPEEVRIAPSVEPAARPPLVGPVLLDDVIRHHVVHVFRTHHENVTRTARALGISRVALRRRLREYGLKAARVS